MPQANLGELEWGSEGAPQIMQAFLDFQKSMEPIQKDAANLDTNSRYLKLGTLLTMVLQGLGNCDMAMMQAPSYDGDLVTVQTVLMHPKSGGTITSSLSLRCTAGDAHPVGSAITYIRRYALAALCGIIIDDDDDGNAATGPRSRHQILAAEAGASSQPMGPSTTAMAVDDKPSTAASASAARKPEASTATSGNDKNPFAKPTGTANAGKSAFIAPPAKTAPPEDWDAWRRKLGGAVNKAMSPEAVIAVRLDNVDALADCLAIHPDTVDRLVKVSEQRIVNIGAMRPKPAAAPNNDDGPAF